MARETTATPCTTGCGHAPYGFIRQASPNDCPACGSIDYCGDGNTPSRDRWMDDHTTLVTCPDCGHRWTVEHPTDEEEWGPDSAQELLERGPR